MNWKKSILVICLLAGLVSLAAPQDTTQAAPTEGDTTAAAAAPTTAQPTEEATTAAPVETTAQPTPEATTAQPEQETTTAIPTVTESVETVQPTTEETTPGQTTSSPGNMTATNETETTAAPPPATTTMPSPVEAKGVSAECREHYHNCTSEQKQEFYCDAFRLAQNCLEENDKNQTSRLCSKEDLIKLELLDCGPVILFNATENVTVVSETCKARVTECLSSPIAVQKLKDINDFREFFCDLAEDTKSCFVKKESNVCSDEEYKSMLDQAQCSSALHLTPGILLIALTFLVQNFLSRD